MHTNNTYDVPALDYDETLEALLGIGGGERVRLTAPNGCSLSGELSFHDFGHTVDVLIDRRGGSSVLSDAVSIERMVNGRYVSVLVAS